MREKQDTKALLVAPVKRSKHLMWALLAAVAVLFVVQVMGEPEAEEGPWPEAAEVEQTRVTDLELYQMSAELPQTPVASQVSWAIGQLNLEGAQLDAHDITARFAPDTLARIPANRLVDVMSELGLEQGPYALVGFVAEPTATEMAAVYANGQGRFQVVNARVEPEAPHRLVELNVHHWR